MKRIYYFAMVMGAAAMFASCSGNKSKESVDSDTVTVEEPKLVTDSLADLLRNPEKKTDVATDSTYAQTASGLKYLVINEGTGAQPTAEDEVTVHYTGRLLSGKVFDSSVQRGEPATFPLNGVIRGWTEGLQLMKEGAKYIFYIPSNLAYGERGAGADIPPYADLIFEVDLIKVNK